MNVSSFVWWPWLALSGLGLFHGLNPAMGWLFAVAIGFHRGSRRVVLLSLIPIAIGHAAAVAIVVLALLAFGIFIEPEILRRVAGLVLIAWALWHAFYGHRQKLRVGMQAGALGLFGWSFLMAAAHGAGLMLVPVLLPLCLAGTPARELTASGSLAVALAAVGVHTAAMLATIAAISMIVYTWVGVAFLRRGWINLDLIWIVTLLACGAFLLVW
jgi:hypothetical protein